MNSYDFLLSAGTSQASCLGGYLSNKRDKRERTKQSMAYGCLCGDRECPACFPGLLDDARRKREEDLADDLHDRRRQQEDEQDD